MRDKRDRKEYKKGYHSRPSVKERQRLYRIEYYSRPENKEKKNRRRRERRKLDQHFRLTNVLRNRIFASLKGRPGKVETSEALLGATIAQTKKWICDQFRDGMNWEAFLRGEIHIDHIIPICYFNLETEIGRKLALNYRNLQPLWKKENLSKGSRITSQEIKKFLTHFDNSPDALLAVIELKVNN